MFLSVLKFGAIGDGATNDTAAIQAALDAAASDSSAIRSVFIPAGTYLVDTLYIPVGVRFYGEMATESSAHTSSKLLQNSGDVIRFKTFFNSPYYYWFGEIEHLTIWGDTSLTAGWGINCKDSAGNTVILQDVSCVHHLVVRQCYEGGINVQDGAFPLTFADSKFLFNNGPGIKLTRTTTFQGVHFQNISGDGNNGGLISLNSLNDGFGSVTVTNLKSEARVNTAYANAEHQTNAIVVTSCNDLPITINGATHTSSIPDGEVYKKPGSLVLVNTGGTPPRVRWSGVAIRVRETDTGTDPNIISGTISPVVSIGTYLQTEGVFNSELRLFNTSLLLSRGNIADGDTTPSVAKHNILLTANTQPTTITDFDSGVDGQFIIVTFGDANTTLTDGGNLLLAGEFTPDANDTITLLKVASGWRELCRSVN